MFIEEILSALRNGKRATNDNWNGKGMYIYAVSGVDFEMLPFLVIRNANGNHIPWTISQQDIFSDGWRILED